MTAGVAAVVSSFLVSALLASSSAGASTGATTCWGWISRVRERSCGKTTNLLLLRLVGCDRLLRLDRLVELERLLDLGRLDWSRRVSLLVLDRHRRLELRVVNLGLDLGRLLRRRRNGRGVLGGLVGSGDDVLLCASTGKRSVVF